MNTGKKKKINLAPYGYLLPCMAVFAVFLFYPFFKTIYLSLYKTNKIGRSKAVCGSWQLYRTAQFCFLSEQLKGNTDICGDCGSGKYAFGADCGSSLQQGISGNSVFQYGVCIAYGHCVQLCSHDFPDYASSFCGHCE